MLCFEGISLMLNIFREKATLPNYRLAVPPDGELQSITVKEEVGNRKRARNFTVILSRFRRQGYDRTFRDPFYEMSDSPKRDTILSSHFKINSTRILHDNVVWWRSAHMI